MEPISREVQAKNDEEAIKNLVVSNSPTVVTSMRATRKMANQLLLTEKIRESNS